VASILRKPRRSPDRSLGTVPPKFRSTEDKAMDVHRFKVGEAVKFTSPFHGRFSASGLYTVVAHRPREDGAEISYLIRCDLDEHQRIARESELDRGPSHPDR
jgi:hypothetical protein